MGLSQTHFLDGVWEDRGPGFDAVDGKPTEARPVSNLTVARGPIDLPLQGVRDGHDVVRKLGGLRARSRTATP